MPKKHSGIQVRIAMNDLTEDQPFLIGMPIELFKKFNDPIDTMYVMGTIHIWRRDEGNKKVRGNTAFFAN